MKLLMVTRTDGKHKSMADLTHPIMRNFAEKWGADFFILSKDADCTSEVGKVFYRIMDVHDLLNTYDRVLHIDSDIVINKNCPDLFELVPNDMVGVIFEDVGTRLKDRRERIRKVQAAWGDIGWKTGYINMGILLVSRLHKEMFSRVGGQYWEDMGFADVHLGYQIHRLGLKVFKLHWHFNHMSIFSESWNGSPSRFNSHIIHYAGGGKFPDKGNHSRMQLIEDDIKRIYG